MSLIFAAKTHLMDCDCLNLLCVTSYIVLDIFICVIQKLGNSKNGRFINNRNIFLSNTNPRKNEACSTSRYALYTVPCLFWPICIAVGRLSCVLRRSTSCLILFLKRGRLQGDFDITLPSPMAASPSLRDECVYNLKQLKV